MTWEPTQYLKYAGERLRPAVDLMARIEQSAPKTVVDLGCGAGNVTRMLAQRWPLARIVGIDNSDSMLARAREASPPGAGIEWLAADLAAWAGAAAPASIDLIYSNAALHWLPDHATLFPQLMEIAAPGGGLAVQMPSNFLAPSHAALQEVVGSARWRGKLGALLPPLPVASASRYFEWLSPYAKSVDVWTTEYLHVLPPTGEPEHPVIAWMKGTALTPFVDVLDAEAKAAFVSDCAERIASAYPPQPDGSVLYPFRRVFIVATRANR